MLSGWSLRKTQIQFMGLCSFLPYVRATCDSECHLCYLSYPKEPNTYLDWMIPLHFIYSFFYVSIEDDSKPGHSY